MTILTKRYCDSCNTDITISKTIDIQCVNNGKCEISQINHYCDKCYELKKKQLEKIL